MLMFTPCHTNFSMCSMNSQDGCISLLVLIHKQEATVLRTHWARHFACALDVFDLLTAEFLRAGVAEAALGPPGTAAGFTFVKQKLSELMSDRHRSGEPESPHVAEFWCGECFEF